MREWKPHSCEKISIFADYIEAFATAAQRAANRVYIDAFAGDTINLLQSTGETFRGSAEIALDADPPFTYSALFERSRSRADNLRRLRVQRPLRNIDVSRAIATFSCRERWRRHLSRRRRSCSSIPTAS